MTVGYKQTKSAQIDSFKIRKDGGGLERAMIVDLASAPEEQMVDMGFNTGKLAVIVSGGIGSKFVSQDQVDIQFDGVALVKLAEKVKKGKGVTAKSGLGITAGAGDALLGHALEDGVADQYISVRLGAGGTV